MIDLTIFQPPICENGINLVRKKRQVVELDQRDSDNAYELVERPETIKVYSGLYVNEAEDLDDDSVGDDLVDVVSLIILIGKNQFTNCVFCSGPMIPTHSVSHKGALPLVSPSPV